MEFKSPTISSETGRKLTRRPLEESLLNLHPPQANLAIRWCGQLNPTVSSSRLSSIRTLIIMTVFCAPEHDDRAHRESFGLRALYSQENS